MTSLMFIRGVVGYDYANIQLMKGSNDSESDPMLASFLAFIQADMANHPENIRPMDAVLLAQIASLVDGAEVDLDAYLGDETVL